MRQRLINADWFCKGTRIVRRDAGGGDLPVMGGETSQDRREAQGDVSEGQGRAGIELRIKAANGCDPGREGKGVAPIEDDALESMFKQSSTGRASRTIGVLSGQFCPK